MKTSADHFQYVAGLLIIYGLCYPIISADVVDGDHSSEFGKEELQVRGPKNGFAKCELS